MCFIEWGLSGGLIKCVLGVEGCLPLVPVVNVLSYCVFPCIIRLRGVVGEDVMYRSKRVDSVTPSQWNITRQMGPAACLALPFRPVLSHWQFASFSAQEASPQWRERVPFGRFNLDHLTVHVSSLTTVRRTERNVPPLSDTNCDCDAVTHWSLRLESCAFITRRDTIPHSIGRG